MALGRGLGALIPQQRNVDSTERAASSGMLEISPQVIAPNPKQPREQFTHRELEDLAASIKEHGILQPLVVRKDPIGGYILIAGERRLRAAKLLGLERVPVVIRETHPDDELILALIENMQRQDLNTIEEAKSYRRIQDEFGLTHDEIAKKMGKSRPVISNLLRLLELPADIQQAIVDGRISSSQGRTLLGLTDAELQRQLFAKMVSGGWNVRMVEDAVSRERISPTRGRPSSKDPNLASLEAKLREVFGTRVEISRRAGRGKISIEFYHDEDFNELIRRLSKV